MKPVIIFRRGGWWMITSAQILHGPYPMAADAYNAALWYSTKPVIKRWIYAH